MWSEVLNIVLAVLSIALMLLSYYLDIRRKIVEHTNAEISKAEDTDKKNIEKRAYVVEQLKAIIPKSIRFIFTDKVLERIVQKAFDEIEEYAQKQSKK